MKTVMPRTALTTSPSGPSPAPTAKEGPMKPEIKPDLFTFEQPEPWTSAIWALVKLVIVVAVAWAVIYLMGVRL